MDGTELDLARLDHVPPPQLRYRDLQWFKDECKRNNVHIPLLIHCGESITDPKDSLDKALRLNPRRIAQGFALREKWDLTRDLRGRNICVETCPISDEILGFAPQAEDAIVHDLLRADVPCALGAGNRTLFGYELFIPLDDLFEAESARLTNSHYHLGQLQYSPQLLSSHGRLA